MIVMRYFYNIDKTSTIKVVKEGIKSKNRKEKEFVKIKEEKIRNENENGQKMKVILCQRKSEMERKTIQITKSEVKKKKKKTTTKKPK